MYFNDALLGYAVLKECFDARSVLIIYAFLNDAFGLPKITPAAFLAARASLVRKAIKSRPISAKGYQRDSRDFGVARTGFEVMQEIAARIIVYHFAKVGLGRQLFLFIN